MVMEQECFVVAAYAITAVVLLVVCADSYVRWRRIRADYHRLFARKDKRDA